MFGRRRRGRRGFEVAGELTFEDADEFRVHVAVFVGDSENDHLLVAEGGSEHFVQAFAVDVFHGENDVGPFDEVERDGVVRVRTGAGGGGFNAGAGGENSFGGGASQPVSTAEEEQVQAVPFQPQSGLVRSSASPFCLRSMRMRMSSWLRVSLWSGSAARFFISQGSAARSNSCWFWTPLAL